MRKMWRLALVVTLGVVIAVALGAFTVAAGLGPFEPGSEVVVNMSHSTDSDPSRTIDGCVRRDVEAGIRVQVGTRGCFGGSDSSIELIKSGESWTLTTRQWVDYKYHKVSSIALDDEQLDEFFEDLEDALEQPLWKVASCGSTNGVYARLTTSCGTEVSEPVVLETHECLNWGDEDERGPPVSRAGQVWEWSRRVFAEHADAPVVEDSPEEQERTAKRWGSLYKNGLRVRHDPVEDWDEPGPSGSGATSDGDSPR